MWQRRTTRPDAQSVLDVAVAIALRDGLRAVTHAAVAGRLDTTARVVAAEGLDESELAAAAFHRIVAAELADIKRQVLGHPSPVAQMTELLQQFSEPIEPDACGLWLEGWSLGRTNAALGEIVRAEQRRWHDFVASVVRRGMRSTDFSVTDPETVAAELLAMMEGVNAYAMVGYGSQDDRMTMLTSFARAQLGFAWEAAASVA